jgi:penicillin-binding protein 1C
VVVLTLIGWFLLPFSQTLPAGLLKQGSASPMVKDRHGEIIAHFTLPDSTRSQPVSLTDIPADLIACTLAAEDKRFFQHGGVDPLALGRALLDGVAQRRVTSGASTITQQLVKISSPPSPRNLRTKAREALAARRLEMTWSKSQILSTYFNRLDYGNLRIGIAEAARFYFQKPLADLSLAECALLAGLPQAPSRLNPLSHPQRAMVRRDTVLRRLDRQGKFPPSRIAAALAEPLQLRPLPDSKTAPWLSQASWVNRSSPISTTLDLQLQRDVETLINEEVTKLRGANLRHASVVILDNASGEILALVSSANWSDPRGGQFNGALTPRSPGSTLKPFTYLLALERHGRNPASILADIPTPFRTQQGLDLPENYDRSYRGPVTLRRALACSLNLPALRELNAMGGPQPLHNLLTRLGLGTLGTDPSQYGLGLTLGNAPVRLLELTNAYATLARQGRYLPVTLFPSKDRVGKSIFDAQAAFLISDILSDSQARAPSFQPGGPLDLPFRCAVKTGTSSDFHDNWCLGYTPEFTVGVWAGNFEQEPMKGISGITGAAPIFNRAMSRVHRDRAATWFVRPAGLVEITADPRTGKLIPVKAEIPTDLAPAAAIPPVASAADFDAEGKAILGADYAEWFNSPHNHRRHELSLGLAPSAQTPLRIISPAADATYLLDPDMPEGSDQLRPVTHPAGRVEWASETLQIQAASPEPIIHLRPGIHLLMAKDRETGAVQTLTLRVKSL